MLKVTPEKEEFFRDQGYLYLPSLLGRETVQPVKSYVLNELKRQKILARGKGSPNRLKGLHAFQQVSRLGQMIVYPGLRDALIPRHLYATLLKLSGAASLTSEREAKLLISLPNQGDWTLEGLDWHRDISKAEVAEIPGVQAFILLDNLSPHGGATLALAGSHKLSGQSRSKRNIDRLIRGNVDSSMSIGGLGLSILEMSGQMGDIYLMDMRLIHTPSINATKNVRLMATVRYFAM